MITIRVELCNGCGACVESCPTGAILVQNGVAVVDQILCKACEVCFDACPQGAIVQQEQVQPGVEVIQMPAVASVLSTPIQAVTMRARLLPALGTFLAWTGREVVPRLAEMALNYLDRRVQSTEPRVNYDVRQYANRTSAFQNRRRRVRRRLRGRK